MKFSCTQENLNQGLAVVSHITGKSINLPILGNVLIKCEDNILKFSATNLEIAVNCAVRGKIEEPGDFTVPSRLFSDYVALLPKERVDVAQDGGAVKVSCGSYQTRLNGIPASEFPLIPTADKRQKYLVRVDDFRKAAGQTLFAVAPNESRPEISGVLFKFTRSGGRPALIMAATDSYRLAEKIVPLVGEPAGLEEPVPVIVPARTMAEVIRILGVFKETLETAENVEISLGEGQIVFTYDNVELISRVIEGRYPDYRQLVPEKVATEATVERDELTRAVRTASLFSKTGLNDIHLFFKPGEGIRLSAANSQTGEHAVDLNCAVAGQLNEVTVNFKYFLDGANNIETGEAIVQIVDGVSPCLIRPVGEKDVPGAYLYIVMPIRQ